MADFTPVQSWGSSEATVAAGTGSSTLTGPTHTAGNPVFVVIGYTGQTRIPGVADDAGNQWVELHRKASLNKSVSIWVTRGTLQITTITISFSAGANAWVSLGGEFSVGGTSGTVVEDSEKDEQGASGNATISSGWTIVKANTLAILGNVTIATDAGDYGSDTGWTNLVQHAHSTVALCAQFEYKYGITPGSTTVTKAPVVGSSWNVAVDAVYFAPATTIYGSGAKHVRAKQTWGTNGAQGRIRPVR